MASRLNFSIGSPVDPTQALQVSLGNIGKYFADYQDRELRREEKEIQQKRWEAENTRAEATHRMQLDEYNRKVAERDALSSVLKSPDAMQQVVEQGAFASPTALRLSNEAAAKGTLVNKDLASVAVAGDSLLQKAVSAQDATMKQVSDLGMSSWGGPEDSAVNQLGLDSDRAKVDLLERINRTASADPRYKDVSRLAGAITTAQKNADVFGSSMMDSTTAAGKDVMVDAVIGEATKGQVRDWYLSGLVSKGVAPEQALSLAELYTKDMVTPQERAKQRLEAAKTNIEMVKLLSQAYRGIGDNSPVNVNISGSDGKIEGGEGVVYRSPNDVVSAIAKDPAFKGTDWLTKDTIAEVSDFVTSKLQELSKDKKFASLNNQELLGLIANSVQLSGRPTGIMDDLNNEGANTRLLADANALAAYKGGVKLDEETKAYAERLLDSINPKQKQTKTSRLSNLTPEQQANIDYLAQNGVDALANTDKQATINEVLPRLAQLSPGIGNVGSATPQQQAVASRMNAINAGINVTPAQQKVPDEVGVLVGDKAQTQKELSNAAANVTSYPLRGRLATAAPVQLMDMTDDLVNAPTRQEAKAIEEARKVNEATRAAKEQEVISKYSKYGNTIQEIHNNSDVPIPEVMALLPKTEDRGFVGRLLESIKDTDVNKVLAGIPLLNNVRLASAYQNQAKYADEAARGLRNLTGSITSVVTPRATSVENNIPAILRKADSFVGPKLPVTSSKGAVVGPRLSQTTPPGLVTNTNAPYISREVPSVVNTLKLPQQVNPTTKLAELAKVNEELVRIGVPRRKLDGGFNLSKVPPKYREAAKKLNSRLAGAQ